MVIVVFFKSLLGLLTKMMHVYIETEISPYFLGGGKSKEQHECCCVADSLMANLHMQISLCPCVLSKCSRSQRLATPPLEFICWRQTSTRECFNDSSSPPAFIRSGQPIPDGVMEISKWKPYWSALRTNVKKLLRRGQGGKSVRSPLQPNSPLLRPLIIY